MYELAWRMSRDNNDLLWWSIVGHTEQLLMLKSEVDKYLIGSGNLRDHVSRLNVNPSVSSDGSGTSENSRSVGKCHISYFPRIVSAVTIQFMKKMHNPETIVFPHVVSSLK